MKHVIQVLTFIACGIFSYQAHATCTSPAGVPGQFQYISGDYKYCANSVWNSMAESTTSTACSSAGAIIRSGNDLFFCNGTNLVGMVGTSTDGSCSVAGTITYDSVNNRIEICNGTSWTLNANAGVMVCGSGSENTNVTISCPSGKTISSIDFASYGTPGGTCGSFTVSSCHATNSSSVVSSSCLNNASCTVNAGNGVFGDPCPGILKSLSIQVTCK